MPRGGARKGAGRKVGTSGLEKEAARELLRQKVFARFGPLIDAQMANAEGIKYLVVRDAKTGKFIRVSEGVAKLADGEELIEVWEKDPSIQAFSDLMNRALDKPKEQEQDLSIRGGLTVKWKGE